MTISVIIPCLNEAENIGRLITHLQKNGDETLLEILVVDAGSVDSTPEIATQLGARVIHAQIQSRAAQMNLGAMEARGSVVYFVHADTLPPRSFVADIRQAFEKGFDLGCYRYRFDSDAFMLRINAFFTRFHWLWCQGGDKTLFIKKALFESLGGFDERYVVMEEYAFLRKALKCHSMVILPRNALVSARKYQRNSWLRVQLANLVAFNLFRLGVAPHKIKSTYRRMLR